MSTKIFVSEAAEWLKARNNILILTHRRPDGDTLGSAGALAQGLREVGKTAYLLPNPETTPRYSQFVDDCWAPEDFTPEHTIIVDTATVELFPQNALIYKDNISLCIDHHDSNTYYADLVCCRPEYAACGEIIYDILIKIAGNISKKTAERLYVAISTDTGCFSFGNTTSNTLLLAARLVEAGAPNRELNKLLFRTKTRGRIKIEGLVTSGMEFHFDGKVAIASITREMMESSGADEDDIDDIASIASSIEGVGIGITVRELSSATDCKISVRTIWPHNASALCAKFGGGGHHSAAGASMKKSVQEIKEDLLVALQDYEF